MTRTINGTKRQAEEALARLLVEMGEGRHQGTGVMTVGDLCRQWLEQAGPSLEPNTAAEFAGVIKRYTPARSDVAVEHDVLRRGIESVPLRKCGPGTSIVSTHNCLPAADGAADRSAPGPCARGIRSCASPWTRRSGGGMLIFRTGVGARCSVYKTDA